MYALRHSACRAFVKSSIGTLAWAVLATLSSRSYAQTPAPAQPTSAAQSVTTTKVASKASGPDTGSAAKKVTDTKSAAAKKNAVAKAAEAKKKSDADAAGRAAAIIKGYADTLCSPSGLTGSAADVAKLSLALGGIKQSTAETRVELSRPYIPDQGAVELLLYRPFSADEKMAYRVFIVNPGDVPGSVAYAAVAAASSASASASDAELAKSSESTLRTYALNAVESTQIEAQAATAMPPATGTDFKYAETTVPKTLLKFSEVVPVGHLYPWQSVRMHVVGCAAPGASSPVAFLASSDSVVAKTSICAWIAIALSAVFYVLAAAASNYVRRVFREFKKGSPPKNTGTNYAGFWRHLNPVVLSAGVNGRGNASKLQILFFSILVFGLVSYMWMRTGHVSGISQNILLLMGISGIGATAAAGTDIAKNRLKFENYAWLINRGWLPKGGIAEVNMAEWKDIFTANGEFDPFRFQMVTFSIFVGASLVGAAVQLDDLTNFAIPDSLLGILGLSQVVYVAGKLVAPPSMSELDAQLDKVKDAEAVLRADLDKLGPSALRGVVVAFKEDDGIKKVRASADTYRQCWRLARTMFESTLGPLLDKNAADRAPPFPVPFLFQDEPIKFVVEPDVAFKVQLAATGQFGSVKWAEAENQRWPDGFEISGDGLLTASAGTLDSEYNFVVTAVDDGKAPPGAKAPDGTDLKDEPVVAVTRRFVLNVRKFEPK